MMKIDIPVQYTILLREYNITIWWSRSDQVLSKPTKMNVSGSTDAVRHQKL